MSLVKLPDSSLDFDRRYFDDDDADDAQKIKAQLLKAQKANDDLAYQPAPGSPSYKPDEKDDDDGDDDDDDDDDDPLEQFMKANNTQAKKDLEVMGKKKEKKGDK